MGLHKVVTSLPSSESELSSSIFEVYDIFRPAGIVDIFVISRDIRCPSKGFFFFFKSKIELSLQCRLSNNVIRYMSVLGPCAAAAKYVVSLEQLHRSSAIAKKMWICCSKNG